MAEEEEKEEMLSQVEDAHKEVDGEKVENSKVTNNPCDNAILVIFDLACLILVAF